MVAVRTHGSHRDHNPKHAPAKRTPSSSVSSEKRGRGMRQRGMGHSPAKSSSMPWSGYSACRKRPTKITSTITTMIVLNSGVQHHRLRLASADWAQGAKPGESQRDSGSKPRVAASNERLPWVTGAAIAVNLDEVAQRRRRDRDGRRDSIGRPNMRNPYRVGRVFSIHTQGSVAARRNPGLCSVTPSA
jgi:hypothetical protein